jgi:hypothetical protein
MSVQGFNPAEGFVTGNIPPTPITGTITVTVTGTFQDNDLQVHLDGEGPGWSAEGQSIHLTPETQEADAPVWFQFTLELIESSLSLVGIQILHHNEENPSSAHAAIFLPASLVHQVELNLLHQIPSTGDTVTYGMFIGLSDGSQTSWHEPSIAFEPDIPPH